MLAPCRQRSERIDRQARKRKTAGRSLIRRKREGKAGASIAKGGYCSSLNARSAHARRTHIMEQVAGEHDGEGQPSANVPGLLSLPTEVLEIILNLLEQEDTLTVRLVCKRVLQVWVVRNVGTDCTRPAHLPFSSGCSCLCFSRLCLSLPPPLSIS